MTKFDTWDSLFASLEGSECEISFAELDAALSGSLPRSAYTFPSWWLRLDLARWRIYGWRAEADIRRRVVRFTHASESNRPALNGGGKTVTRLFPSERRLVLLGGVAAKRERPQPAGDLYRSTLWAKRKAYATASGNQWMIMSALYGLVSPDTIIEPYDFTLRHEGVAYRRSWSETVVEQVVEACLGLSLDLVEVHAGADYLQNGLADGLNSAGLTVSWPLKGRRTGDQLSWYGLAISALEAASNSLEKEQTAAAPAEAAYPIDRRSPTTDTAADRESNLRVDDNQLVEPRTPLRVVEEVELSAVDLLASDFKAAHPIASSFAVSGLEVAEQIAAFGRFLHQEDDGLAATPEDERLGRLVTEDPFGLIIAILMDRKGNQFELTDRSREMYRRLGYHDLDSIASDPYRVQRVLARSPQMASAPERVARWIVDAAQGVLDEYAGDASTIWPVGITDTELRRRLQEFKGIGRSQANLAVDLIEKYGVPLASSRADLLTMNAVQRRVAIRAGLIEFDDLTHMTMPMVKRMPADARAFLDALVEIGEGWCHSAEPRCVVCPIGDICPRIVGDHLQTVLRSAVDGGE